MLIQPYNQDWVVNFEKIEKALIQILMGLKVYIEHVGSTSIPGLAAKPIIDIDIVYQPYDQFPLVKSRLSEIGYIHCGNQGIIDREVFKRKGNEPRHDVLDLIRHHLYVCPSGSAELKKHLIFRDCLRESVSLRESYQDLKYQIAIEANQDHKSYAVLKETRARGFILSVIESANKSDV